MVGTVFVIILFILVVSVCCCSDSSPSSKSTAGRNTTTLYNRTGNRHSHHAYCECPSCGAPYYDGYCDECGYPDINQGWIGENY